MANLREAFEYAAKNPESDFAKNLEQLAGSGALDVEAKKYGVDLTPFKPELTPAQKIGQVGRGALKEGVRLAFDDSIGKGILDMASVGIEKATGVQMPRSQGLGIAEANLPENDNERLGATITDVASIAAPFAPAVAAKIGGGVKAGAEIVGETATKALAKATPDPVAIMQRVARIPKGRQAAFEQASGESVGEYLTKRDIYGNTEEISQKLFNRFQTSKKAADDALEQIQGTYRAEPVNTALNQLLDKVQRVSAQGAPDRDLARVKELVTKNKKEGLTMTEINEVKRLFEKRVRLDYVRENVADGVAMSNNIDDALRNWQFTEAEKAGLLNLPEINRETRLAKQLLDDLGRENAGSAGNNALSLTDYILLAGGEPSTVSAFFAKKILETGKVQSAVAKRLSKNKEKVGTPEAQFKEKLGLPAPKSGAAKSSNNVPINLTTESQSTIQNRETKRNAKKR